MQPYLFPYLGYFQLISAVDKFVVYDDVNFIKQGWINRNNILLNGNKHLFTLPLEKVTSFHKINETKISQKLYIGWKRKFEKTLYTTYRKAPHFDSVFELIKNILGNGINCESIAEFCTSNILKINNYLKISTKIQHTSATYNNCNLAGVERVMAICKAEKAKVYINPIGGKKLYSKQEFEFASIELYFLKTCPVFYKQFENDFIPNLSIIDCMMFNSIEEVISMLNNFELI